MNRRGRPGYPERVVCLTEETTETLYAIGAGHLVVGVSGYTVRPPEARQKPRVSSFIQARFDKIEALSPDLIFAFSDLQADIVRELVKRGLTVCTFNQRTLTEILMTIRQVGALVGYGPEAESYADSLASRLDATRTASARLQRRPRVYFEEWFDPLICGISWVSELIQCAGGEDVFAARAQSPLARNRTVTATEVRAADPDIIVASWCGRKVRTERIAGRPEFAEIRAVRDDQITEIKSTFILQPGPAALTEGLDQLCNIVKRWSAVERAQPAAGPR